MIRVELESWLNQTKWAEYDGFHVADYTDNYRLTGLTYIPDSTAPNMLWSNINRMFSTAGRDHDTWDGVNCATQYGGGGGFWYDACSYAHPAPSHCQNRGQWTKRGTLYALGGCFLRAFIPGS